MSKIQVNEIVNHFDTGAPDCPKGLTVTGFSTFSGGVSIGGTLTYEDVTNIDSVGLSTFQSGIHVTGGSVGIGTDNPAAKLEVATSVDGQATLATFKNTSGGGTNETVDIKLGLENTVASNVILRAGKEGNHSSGAAADNFFAIHTALNNTSSERLRINSAGFIGIGTDNPGNVLHLQKNGGDAILELQNSGNGNHSGIFFVRESSGGVNKGAANIHVESNTSGSGSALVFGCGSNISSTGSERLRIQSNGNTGIGSDAPSQKLNVDGNVMLDGNDQFMYLSSVGTGNNGLYIRGNSQGASPSDYFIRSHTTGIFTWESSGNHRMQLNADGTLIVAGTSYSFGDAGARISQISDSHFTRNGGNVIAIRRNTNDGSLLDFYQDGTAEGAINVSGSDVTLAGATLSRWTQLPGNAERTEILRGTVLSNLDEMCEWGDEDNEQLNRMKVSDVEGDVNVAGVFRCWDDDDETYLNDYYCAMTGDFVIRIAQGVTVARGDLLMSAGDGTAKPQGDDIVRSKTVAKVTSTTVSATYSDGSYCVPCVLMAC